ncbi:hypothetical protein [Streptomyces eurocidicus]|uniref:Uncharacterized protein n=2 Tax=Streptomyces eurocidicus TaxID=66423 RepID=A0A7W8F5F5_STREU|nr:hypothetical protein [Streptomyces eurocidicus]MBB5122747.1 hypothetical protein [Streptomyces eurocidicus]MBF6055206.1 hypothetical protein [Streptomyces eurocidicus]
MPNLKPKSEPKSLTGTAKLIIAPFLYGWPDKRCLLAYTSHEGLAVVAALPDEKGMAPSLWDVAANHLPTNIRPDDTGEQYARWLVSTGWGYSVIRWNPSLILDGEEWTVTIRKTLREFKEHQYGRAVCGWYGVHTGTLTLKDPLLTNKARDMLNER